MSIFWIVPIAGVAALIFAILMARDVLRRDPGNEKMQEIGNIILEGAMAFMKRQYTTIGWIAILVAVLVGIVLAVLSTDKEQSLLHVSAFGIG